MILALASTLTFQMPFILGFLHALADRNRHPFRLLRRCQKMMTPGITHPRVSAWITTMLLCTYTLPDTILGPIAYAP
jgi:hypothetical protein